MNNIAIIPARSGSKGLTDKNIKLLHGKPLMAYSIEAAFESNNFTEIMVSTDSNEYADIAKQYGASVPFLRSAQLSGDNIGSWDVVRDVLSAYRKNGRTFDTVCLLQPTSPLRNAEDIIMSYIQLEQREADSVTSMCECEHSPLWSTVLDDTFSLIEFRKRFKECPRQQISTYYRLNGAIYIRKIQYDSDEIVLSNANEYAYIMSKEKSVDIDAEYDFVIAEAMMNHIKHK